MQANKNQPLFGVKNTHTDEWYHSEVLTPGGPFENGVYASSKNAAQATANALNGEARNGDWTVKERPNMRFTPALPPHWNRVIGAVPISPNDLCTWNEDIYSAQWLPTEDVKPGDGWWIHLDGGKGISTLQCTLAEPNSVDSDGNLLHNRESLMRDFMETTQEVQAWIDRAVVVAQKAQDCDDAREEEEKKR